MFTHPTPHTPHPRSGVGDIQQQSMSRQDSINQASKPCYIRPRRFANSSPVRHHTAQKKKLTQLTHSVITPPFTTGFAVTVKRPTCQHTTDTTDITDSFCSPLSLQRDSHRDSEWAWDPFRRVLHDAEEGQVAVIQLELKEAPWGGGAVGLSETGKCEMGDPGSGPDPDLC